MAIGEARTAVKLANRLLDQLELLALANRPDVPGSLSSLIGAVNRTATEAGIRPPVLESDSGIFRLMDDVYALEARLLPRCRAVRTIGLAG